MINIKERKKKVELKAKIYIKWVSKEKERKSIVRNDQQKVNTTSRPIKIKTREE
jgi:hypothetical protein